MAWLNDSSGSMGNLPIYVPPTTEQKLAIYLKAREHVQANREGLCCICQGIKQAQRDLGFTGTYFSPKWRVSQTYNNDYGNNMENNFPELLRRKPKGKCIENSWWMQPKRNPSIKRLMAINDIIKELQESL
jgi:hypothetical protein